MNDESELRDQTVTDAAEDLELQDDAAQGVGGGSTARPIASPPLAGGGTSTTVTGRQEVATCHGSWLPPCRRES